MMKITFNLVLTMTAVATVLASCQPKDVTINKPGAVSVNTNSTGNNLSGVEINKLLALSLDRQVEPLHLLKAVLNSQYASAHGLMVTIDPVTQVKKLTAINSLQTFDTAKYSSEYALNYEIQSLSQDINGKLISMVLKNTAGTVNQSKGVIKNTSKGTDYSAKSVTEYVSVLATANANEYTVTSDRVDDSGSAADKQSYIFSSIVSIVTWDGTVAALDSDLPLKISQFKVDRKGANKTGFLSYQEFASTMTVKLDQCISSNGTVTLTQSSVVKGTEKMTPPTYKKVDTVVTVTDSTYQVGSAFTSAAKDCATRPVVDLTRLL